MLTRNGWILAGAAVALVVAGRLLGVFELFLLGGAAGALVIMSALYVGLTRLRVQVTRQVRPFRIHAGTPARVDIAVRNLGRRTPVLRVVDPVSGTRGADLSVGPLAAASTGAAAYRVPTERRGQVDVGPLTVEISDPFGLSVVSLRAAEVAELTVFPRVDPVDPVPWTVGQDPHGAADAANSLGRTGEEFYALRRYTVGDDLRRVHWPSTARMGDLMVRQDELPWQGRATVLLDTRRAAHDDESFEAAVSAAASILSACARRRDLVRVVTTDGGDSGFATGHAHVDAIMEYLATAQLSDRGTLQGSLTMLQRTTDGGALALVGAALPREEVDAGLRMRNAFGAVLVVRFSEFDLAATTERGVVVTARHLLDFPGVWNRAVATRRSSQELVR